MDFIIHGVVGILAIYVGMVVEAIRIIKGGE